jgi:hypothetical protein
MTPISKVPRTVKNTGLLRSMVKRRGMKLETTSRKQSSSAGPVQNVAVTRNGRLSTEHANQSDPTGGKKVEIALDDPDHPSVSLKRQPKGIIRSLKHLPARIKHFLMILRPPLTPDELERREFLRVEQSRNKLCIREGNRYGKMASEKLAQLGMRELLGSPSPDKPRKLKLVRWSMITRDELFTKIILHMDTSPRHLPHYVRVSELGRNPLYADEMLPTIGHFVKWNSDDYGVTLTIFRHGLDGLPEFVAAEDIWKKVPVSKPLLTFPVGYGDNSARTDVDLDDCPHMIVAGATKQGKSNFINQMICFWLWRGLTIQDLQLILFDLKRGMEFTFYEGLPHLYRDDEEWILEQQDHEKEDRSFITTGIIEELKDVMPALLRLRQLMDKRLMFIKNAGHKDFNAFNRAQHSRQKKMPSMVIVFDEWARIRLSLGTQPENLLAEMTNLARAAGMYFVIGTQNPNTSVISPLIGVNFSTRLIFKCSVGGSMAALGNQSAVGLEEKGRGILQDGGDEKKLQTPRISDGLIQAVVYKAITGKDKKFTNALDMEEILQYALDNLDGLLDVNKLYQIFREKKVRRNWLITALREAEGQQFILSGTTYRISPRGNHVARSLIREDN